MRRTELLVAACVCLAWTTAGCIIPPAEDFEWLAQPERPAWASQTAARQPAGMMPADALGNDIGIFYVSERPIMVAHPSGHQPNTTPRVMVHVSTDQGKTYRRAGVYDVAQEFLPVQAGADGEYWVRFTGPGPAVPQSPLPRPHRVYFLDTQPPAVTLSVTSRPNETLDEPAVYQTGEYVEVRWRITDANLQADAITLATAFDGAAEPMQWTKLPARLDPVGIARIEIPAEAAGRMMLVRVSGADKAGNEGAAQSDPLAVAGEAVVLPATPRAPVVTVEEPMPPVVAVEPRTPLVIEGGWPIAGSTLPGGSQQVLVDLPTALEDYPLVVLQFSADGGQTWTTLADAFLATYPIPWTVPQVDSKTCKIRLVSLTDRGDGQRQPDVTLRESETFAVAPTPAP